MISYNKNLRFTLIEVLLAVGISVMVLGIISSAAWSTIDSTSKAERRLDISDDCTMIKRRLREDFRGSRLHVERAAAELNELDEDEAPAPAFFVESDGDEIRIDFFTTAAVTGPAVPRGIYRVDLRFNQSRKILERRQAHIAQVDMDDVPWRTIGEDIDTFDILFFDGEEWFEEWDSSEENSLPYSIKIFFRLARDTIWAEREFIVVPLSQER